MPPLPKRKYAKTRQRLRRQHDIQQRATIVRCTRCAVAHQAHHVCWNCGTYRGRQVLDVEEA